MDLSEKVKNAKDAIDNIPSLIDAFLELVKTPYGWVVFCVFFVWLLVNKDVSRFYNIFEKKDKKKYELDTYLLEADGTDAETVKAIRDLRDAHYFKIATRIYAEKNFRKALISLHDVTSHLVTWTQIRRSLQYIDVSHEGKISIRKFNVFEKIGYWCNLVVGFFMLFVSAVIFSAFALTGVKSFNSMVLSFFGTILVMAFAIYSFSQNWPIHSARTIKNELEKQKKRG